MFKKKQTPAPALQEAIDLAVEELKSYEPNSEAYAAIVEQIERLHAMNTTDKDRKWNLRVSPDALLAVAGNLAGIGLILKFEQVNVLTSKAIGFVVKSRI